MRTKRQQLLLRWGGLAGLAVVVVAAVALLVSRRVDPSAPAADGSIEGLTSVLSREVTEGMVQLRFEEVASQAGIDFHHFPATRGSLLPEDMGSGVAWGDYDGDGDPDLYLANFAHSILDESSTAVGRPALYRNEGGGRFTEVSEEAGVATPGFGLAACWGDYDDDRDLDLYLTNYGRNLLYRNQGDGTFVDVTERAGVGDEQFSAGCAWGDYDGDGRLDLYVANYVEFVYSAADRDRSARQYGSEIPYTINPSSYPPAANRLYRNRGDGIFAEVAEEAGVADGDGRSLGASWFDFDNDGLLDLYVANDVSANGVYRNLGAGKFADIGASSLAADYRGAMGLAVADYEHDGDLDLFVTHWVAQENAFFENMVSEGLPDEQGGTRLFFMDSSEINGLGQISLKMVGWATGFVDLDNDGYVDLWVVNGNTMEMADDTTRLKPQPMQIFRQQTGEGFFEMGARACPRLVEPFVGRGGAHADFDGDGRVDIAVMVHGGSPLLLHNVTESPGHWLALRLRQHGGNTQALGARVTLRTGDRLQTAQVGTGGSYLSQHHGDLHFGLGAAHQADEITIHWPDGATETLQSVEGDRVVTLVHEAEY